MGFIPLVNMMIPFASSLVLGIPMMLYFSKIKKFGMVLITYIIYGAILTLAGVGIYSLIAGTLCALIAEFILKAKRYASISAAILSYAVCSVGANANVLGFAFMTEAQLAEKDRLLWAGIYGHYLRILLPWLYAAASCDYGLCGRRAGRPAGESCPEKALCQERNDLMQGILFAEKPRARQLYLDARTKIFLCLTVSFLMFSCEYTGVMRFVLPVLAAVPFVSFLILRRYRKAAVYGMVYVLCLMLPMLLRQLDAPVFSIISGALSAIFTQMLPGLAMFDVLLSSTTVSEFIRAMDGFHISKKFSVPVSVMFRFFPTIREEYGMIRDALRLRGVGGLEHPLEMLEYRMVPLLTELMQVGNELSASAMTRGLDTPGKRSNVCPMGFRVQDIAVFLLCVAVVSLFIFAKVTGR